MPAELFFALPGNEKLTAKLAGLRNAETGKVTIRKFPDGETFVQVNSDVQRRRVVLVCTLHNPDAHTLPLFFLARTVRDLGAESICLVAPYLAYMRQDKRFHPGEAITSAYFGAFISGFADSLLTIDPHLHRHSNLGEVYSIPNQVMHAAGHVAYWIKHNIARPVLIGPDQESEQWVSEVAQNAGAPYVVFEKTRSGDKQVSISASKLDQFKTRTPVLVDDIISTATTMIETAKQLKLANLPAPVCIGVHAVFAGDAYRQLLNVAADVVTCNTIPHPSNQIDISDILADGYATLLQH